MKCPHCGEDHPDQIIFCPATGLEIGEQNYCEACGTRIQTGWKVCPKCGTAVGEASDLISGGKDRQSISDVKPKIPLIPRIRVFSLAIIIIIPVMLVGGVLVIKSLQPPLPEEENITPTPSLEDTPTVFLLPTLPPPLVGVEFPEQIVEYPAEWPAELHYPEEFMLVEVTLGRLDPSSPRGWAAKLRFNGNPQNSADLLIAFFTENGWKIGERTKLDSGGVLLLIEKDAGDNQGVLVFDQDLIDPSYTNIIATVFP